MSTRTGSIAVHVAAAQRLLTELDTQANAAIQALGRENSAEFFAAVDARDRLLAELGSVADALAHERALGGAPATPAFPSTQAVREMAYAAAAALESHERLVASTRSERDRLGTAAKRASKPDAVAMQYANPAGPPGR